MYHGLCVVAQGRQGCYIFRNYITLCLEGCKMLAATPVLSEIGDLSSTTQYMREEF